MKHLSITILAAGLTVFAEAATLETRGFGKSVTLTASGYSGASTLANFPALVRLSNATGFDFADFTAPAAELRFTDANGDSLDFEIDTWDAASGTALVWVSVPSLAASTAITAYFAPAAGATLPAVSPTAVWTKAGYVGVWHLNAKANGAYPDSSGVSAAAQAYDTSATFADPVAATSSDYAIGSYLSNNTAGLFLPASATAGWDFGDTGLSVEFWTLPGGSWPLMFSNQTTLNTSTGFGVAPAGSKFAYSVNGIGTKPSGSGNNGLRQCEFWWGTVEPMLSYKTHWRFVTLTWKSSTASANGGLFAGWPQDDVYVVRDHAYDTNVNNTPTPSPVSTYPATKANGFEWPNGMYLSWGTSSTGKDNRLDEMRIRAAMTTEDWAAANYATQNKDAAFFEYGEVEDLAAESAGSTVLIY